MTAMLVLLPIVMAGLLFLLRRWRAVSALLATAFSLALGLILLWVPAGEPLRLFGLEIVLSGETTLLGRTLVLNPATQAAGALLFLSGAVFFFLDWQLEREGLLVPIGLGLLGLLVGVLLVRPLIYAALLLDLVAALTVFPIHADPRSPVRAGLRYLTFFTLALPGLMVSHSLLDLYAMAPDQTQFLYVATALIAFSFALLLGVVPFHLWVPAVGRDGSPVAVAFLFSATGGVVWFLLLDYLRAYPWLSGYAEWSTAVSALGMATAVIGGLLATARQEPGRLMGYMVMVDTGLMLVALAQAGRVGVELGVAMILARPWGLALMAAGVAGLRSRGSELGRDLTGVGLAAPWTTLALAVGGLSLLGFPATAGFAPRWGLFRLLAHSDPVMALLLLLAVGGALIGLLRQLNQFLQTPPRPLERLDGETPAEETPLPAEGFLLAVTILVLAVGVFGLGLFPQLLSDAAAGAGAYFALSP